MTRTRVIRGSPGRRSSAGASARSFPYPSPITFRSSPRWWPRRSPWISRPTPRRSAVISTWSPSRPGDDGFANIIEDITERRQAEDALRASEERYRALFNNMTEGFALHEIVTDEAGRPCDYRFLDVNPAFERLTGLRRADVVGRPVTEVLTDIEPFWIETYGRVALTGEPCQVREILSGAAQPLVRGLCLPHRLPSSSRSSSWTSPGARPEEALRESEKRHERSQEIAHLGSWELDIVHDRLIWSDEIYRIFGLQPQEFGATYEAFLAAVHPDDRAAVDAAYSESLRENRDSYEIEHRIVRKNTGEVRFVHEKCEHFRDADGRIVRSVGMVHDITERKRADALRQALAEQERLRLGAAVEQASDAVVMVDLDGRIQYVNAAFEAINRLPEADAFGQDYVDLVGGGPYADDIRGAVSAGEVLARTSDPIAVRRAPDRARSDDLPGQGSGRRPSRRSHHRTGRHRGNDPPPGGPSGPEDGSPRDARRRHYPRLQQHSRRHHHQHGAGHARSGREEPGPRVPASHPQGGQPRPGLGQADRHVQPPARTGEAAGPDRPHDQGRPEAPALDLSRDGRGPRIDRGGSGDGPRRPGAAPPDPLESLPERRSGPVRRSRVCRRQAGGRSGRRGLGGPSPGPQARSLRPAHRCRFRMRHVAGDAGTHLRTVLHHPEPGGRQRARPLGRPRHRQELRGGDHGLQRGGQGQHVQRLPALLPEEGPAARTAGRPEDRNRQRADPSRRRRSGPAQRPGPDARAVRL